MGVVVFDSDGIDGTDDDRRNPRPGQTIHFAGHLPSSRLWRISYRLNPLRRIGMVALASTVAVPVLLVLLATVTTGFLRTLAGLYLPFAATVALMLLVVAPRVGASRLRQSSFAEGVSGSASDDGLRLTTGSGESMAGWQVFTKAVVTRDLVGLVEGNGPVAVPILRQWFASDRDWHGFVLLVTGKVRTR